MAREYRVTIVSDLSGREIPAESEIATVEVRLADGTAYVGEVSREEALALAANFRPKRKRASGRPRRPDGTFVPAS